MFQSIKNRHLKAYLETRYDVDILKKYGAYLLVKDNVIVDFFYTLEGVHNFLEGNPDYVEILSSNGIPEKLLKKWKNKQVLPTQEVEKPSDEEESED